jgi:hypothetical protein
LFGPRDLAFKQTGIFGLSLGAGKLRRAMLFGLKFVILFKAIGAILAEFHCLGRTPAKKFIIFCF